MRTVNEVRQWMGLPPLASGDVPIVLGVFGDYDADGLAAFKREMLGSVLNATAPTELFLGDITWEQMVEGAAGVEVAYDGLFPSLKREPEYPQPAIPLVARRHARV